MGLLNSLLEIPFVYKTWANATLTAKMDAIRSLLPPLDEIKALDIGCGPAINTALFGGCDYTGIDINPEYIGRAKRKFPDKKFYTQDVTKWDVGDKKYDVILFNSMIHHIPDQEMISIFFKVHTLLNENGSIILSEPLIPEPHDKICWWAMRLDRGKYFRSREGYHRLFRNDFIIEKELAYPLKIFGITGWHMYNMRLKKK